METNNLYNVLEYNVDGTNILMFSIPQGHVRFSSNGFVDGTYALIMKASDKGMMIPGSYTREELWDDQTIVPVYAMHFHSIEQIEAYIKAFNSFLLNVRKYEEENHGKGNCEAQTDH